MFGSNPTGVWAQGSAYTKGYKDALCDAVSCNGHGYEPSCPGDHSSEYCNNYRDGYAAGWDASTNANSNGQQPPMNSPPPPFSQAPDQAQGVALAITSTEITIQSINYNYNKNNLAMEIVAMAAMVITGVNYLNAKPSAQEFSK